jgi:hypothetical protein
VQHTRAQATALDSLNQQLAASELSHRRLAASTFTCLCSEPAAAAERQTLIAEVRALESAVAILTARLPNSTGQPVPSPAQPPTPRPVPDMSELIRLQEVAREEAYQRFEALRELEEARASAAAAAHSRRPQTAAPSLGSHRRVSGDPGRWLRESRESPRRELGQDDLGASGFGWHRADRELSVVWPRVQPRELVGGALTGSPWDLHAEAGGGAPGVCAWTLDSEALPLRPARAVPRRLRVAARGTEEPARWV